MVDKLEVAYKARILHIRTVMNHLGQEAEADVLTLFYKHPSAISNGHQPESTALLAWCQGMMDNAKNGNEAINYFNLKQHWVGIFVKVKKLHRRQEKD